MKIYKERRLYYFTCNVCGSKTRNTFKRSKAKKGICKKCRRHEEINKNQLTLFPISFSNLKQT